MVDYLLPSITRFCRHSLFPSRFCYPSNLRVGKIRYLIIHTDDRSRTSSSTPTPPQKSPDSVSAEEGAAARNLAPPGKILHVGEVVVLRVLAVVAAVEVHRLTAVVLQDIQGFKGVEAGLVVEKKEVCSCGACI